MSKNMSDGMDKNQIYALKAIAIFGVVTAHGTAVPDEFSEISKIISAILQSIGSMGVGIFFCASGYLLALGTSRYLSFMKFWKRKFVVLIIPWMLSATLVYIYVAVRKGGTIIGWLVSMLGLNSTYWYLFVLMFLYMAFWFILKSKNYRIMCVLSCICSVLSVMLRKMHMIQNNAVTVYNDVFHWCIFMALGILLAKTKRIWRILYKIQYVLYFGVITIVALLGVQKIHISYTSWFYIPIEISVIFVAICLSKTIADQYWVRRIGEISFSIYLYHQLPWAGLTANLCNRIDQWILVLIRPFVVLGMTYLMLWGGMRVAQLMNLESLYCRLTRYYE